MTSQAYNQCLVLLDSSSQCVETGCSARWCNWQKPSMMKLIPDSLLVTTMHLVLVPIHWATTCSHHRCCCTVKVGQGMETKVAEDLGRGVDFIHEVSLSIEKISVTAKSRALKAAYSMEVAQDMRAIHGLGIEDELSNIITAELLAEINREVVRTIYKSAKAGAQRRHRNRRRLRHGR